MATSTTVEAVRSLARASRIIERSSGELSLADYRVLLAITAGEARASRLASRLALGKPTISASVDSLMRRGLLAKTQVPGDARASELSITAQGAAVFASAERLMAERFDALCAKMPDALAVLTALATLGDAIDAAMIEREARA